MWMFQDLKESEIYVECVDFIDGVYVVFVFVGLGILYWDSDVCGLVFGLICGMMKEYFICVMIELFVYQMKDVFDVMEVDLGIFLKILCVDGGVVKNNFFMQF